MGYNKWEKNPQIKKTEQGIKRKKKQLVSAY